MRYKKQHSIDKRPSIHVGLISGLLLILILAGVCGVAAVKLFSEDTAGDEQIKGPTVNTETTVLDYSSIPAYNSAEEYGDYYFTKTGFNVRCPQYSEYKRIDGCYVLGRIYLKLSDISDGFYKDIPEKATVSRGIYSMCLVDGEKYVSINLLTAEFGLSPLFYSDNNNIDLVYRGNTSESVMSEPAAELKTAYIRLEDIAPNGPYGGHYTDTNLAKLRIMSDYLKDRGHGFYIALIMWYKDPLNNVDNNLTENINLYNASFLYTMDYLISNGGKIVLHGMTHQYGDSVSAVGDEYGKDSPYASDKQFRNRIVQTKEMARLLCFEDDAFEFPHYTATPNQIEIASEFFDVIYQQKQPSATPGHIETLKNGEKITYFIPTPADYVQSVYDKDGMLQRMEQSVSEGKELSLFYHPNLDFSYIGMSVTTERTLSYKYPDNAVLPSILSKAVSLGYKFAELKEN